MMACVARHKNTAMYTSVLSRLSSNLLGKRSVLTLPLHVTLMHMGELFHASSTSMSLSEESESVASSMLSTGGGERARFRVLVGGASGGSRCRSETSECAYVAARDGSHRSSPSKPCSKIRSSALR